MARSSPPWSGPFWKPVLQRWMAENSSPSQKWRGASQGLKQSGASSAAGAQVGRRPLPSATTPGRVGDPSGFVMPKVGPRGAGGSEGKDP